MINENNIKSIVDAFHNENKINPADLSKDQDLAIAIMNLIAIEEHLFFTGAKTQKTSYYDMIYDIREMRKELLQKIIKEYEGEIWCTSKHLLTSSMRLMEVGTKELGQGNKESAYDFFQKSYDLYMTFWMINMSEHFDKGVLETVKDASKNLISKVHNIVESHQGDKSKSYIKKTHTASEGIKIKFNTMKSMISAALNCCKE